MDPPAQGQSQYTHLCTQTQHGCSCTVTVSIHSLMYTNTAWILQHRDSLNTLTYVHKHSMIINKHSMDPPAQGRSQYTHLCTQTQHGCSCTVTVSIHSLMYTNTAWILQHRDSLNTLTYVHKHRHGCSCTVTVSIHSLMYPNRCFCLIIEIIIVSSLTNLIQNKMSI